MGIATFNANENARVFVVPTSGTVKNLYVRTFTAQPATGSLVLTVRKNGADTALTITVPASSAANKTSSDTVNSFAVSAGDRISMKIKNNAAAASANVLNYSFIVE